MSKEHQKDCMYDGYDLSNCPDCLVLIAAYNKGREDAAYDVYEYIRETSGGFFTPEQDHTIALALYGEQG